MFGAKALHDLTSQSHSSRVRLGIDEDDIGVVVEELVALGCLAAIGLWPVARSGKGDRSGGHRAPQGDGLVHWVGMAAKM